MDIRGKATKVMRLRRLTLRLRQVEPPAGRARFVEASGLGPEPAVESWIREIEEFAAVIPAFDGVPLPVGRKHARGPAGGKGRRIVANHRTGLRHDDLHALLRVVRDLFRRGKPVTALGSAPTLPPNVIGDDLRPAGIDDHHVDRETARGKLAVGLVELVPIVVLAFALPVAERPEWRKRRPAG